MATLKTTLKRDSFTTNFGNEANCAMSDVIPPTNR